MARFRKKPVLIEAVRVTASDYNPALSGWARFDSSPFDPPEPPDWLLAAIQDAHIVPRGQETDYAVWDIKTVEGTMTARPGDWIIQGVKGELYPCQPDIFAATYELVEE